MVKYHRYNSRVVVTVEALKSPAYVATTVTVRTPSTDRETGTLSNRDVTL